MKLIPLFPLELVVFPYEELNLHIFEPRYRQLILDCHEKRMSFGIPYYRHGAPLQYGTIVELTMISNTYDDGRMDIKTKGIRPFDIKRFVKQFPEKLYPGGIVEELYWEIEGDIQMMQRIKSKLADLYDYMQIKTQLEALHRPFVTFEIAHKVGFNKDQEYAFLQIIAEVDRQQFMLDHLDKMIPMIREAEAMRKKIQLNGHFKHIQPPLV